MIQEKLKKEFASQQKRIVDLENQLRASRRVSLCAIKMLVKKNKKLVS